MPIERCIRIAAAATRIRQLCLAGLFALITACTQNEHAGHPHDATNVGGPTPAPTAFARLRVYYTKLDGEKLGRFGLRLSSAHDLPSEAYLVTVAAVTGPPAGVPAIHFPAGTTVKSVHISDDTATVDLSSELAKSSGGGFREAGEFKALVWSLTALPGITHVKILVDGATLPTLPGGHFELDEPLSRSDW